MSAGEPLTKTVDGLEYQFSKYGAKQGLKTLLRLSKMIGKPLAIAVGSAKGEGSLKDKQIDMSVIGEAIQALTEQIDQDEVLSLVEQLTATDALCDGKKIIFNSHYEGRYGHMFKVMAAALEVQYGNFFEEISGLVGSPKNNQVSIQAKAQLTGASGAQL